MDSGQLTIDNEETGRIGLTGPLSIVHCQLSIEKTWE